MSHVFHRHCHTSLPTVVSGQGIYLTDSEGKQYLDGCGGAAVSNLGHNHQRIKTAIRHQLEAIPYAHSGFFTSNSSEQLAKRLAELAPGALNHTYFVSGGSEAVEAALKLARQYFVEKGKPTKSQFIARRQSYHGNTLGALSVGGNEWRREPFRPILSAAHHIAPCYAYRDQQQGETELDYSLRVANELEHKILELGADNVMAFIAEPVVGATAGALPATAGYFKRIREICDTYDVLLILDEVMCGIGRTGTFFAFEQEGIVPDIVTVAKGLGAGYQPIGAAIVHDRIYQAIAEGSGFFQHGHTFMGHPMACAAALATVDTIVDDSLLDNVKLRGSQLMAKLNHAVAQLPYIGDIRGKGLFIGIELVADRQTKTPLPSYSQAHKAIKSAAMNNGLMCYPMSGTIDGKSGHHILLAPPFIIEEHQLDELVSKLHTSLLQASALWI
ncbi:aspartate aminotransferase family protein [Photobacterium rosenbergii]|uniref:aspartate aminotransferase family protein n=1 Tax=Photobacterium rosenbergii TaxID=294936 RepID=UPI001C99BE33|nr:aspartate aminotransferase family protein [Photobacterium rosenbergii]MBY5945220.1 aspartate aminotransferase family protein [Photobacterium rosenbergii]